MCCWPLLVHLPHAHDCGPDQVIYQTCVLYTKHTHTHTHTWYQSLYWRSHILSHNKSACVSDHRFFWQETRRNVTNVAEDTQPVTDVGFCHLIIDQDLRSLASPHLSDISRLLWVRFWGSWSGCEVQRQILPLLGITVKSFSHQNRSCDTHSHTIKDRNTHAVIHTFIQLEKIESVCSSRRCLCWHD